MWQPRAGSNAPQDILDFINALSMAIANPDSLKPLVQAAYDIAEANKLTEDLIQKTKDAQATIDAAAQADSALAEARTQLKNDQTQLGIDQQKLKDDIKRNDDRGTALTIAEGKLKTAQIQLQKDQDAVINNRGALVADQKKLGIDQLALLDATTQLNAKAETINAAHALVTGATPKAG